MTEKKTQKEHKILGDWWGYSYIYTKEVYPNRAFLGGILTLIPILVFLFLGMLEYWIQDNIICSKYEFSFSPILFLPWLIPIPFGLYCLFKSSKILERKPKEKV